MMSLLPQRMQRCAHGTIPIHGPKAVYAYLKHMSVRSRTPVSGIEQSIMKKKLVGM